MNNFDPKSIRDGKAWCDVINVQPLPVQEVRMVVAIGSCKADGSDFKPYDEPIVRPLIL